MLLRRRGVASCARRANSRLFRDNSWFCRPDNLALALRVVLSALATAAWCIASTAPASHRTPPPSISGKTMRIVVGFSSGRRLRRLCPRAGAPYRPSHSRQSDRRGAEHAGRRQPQVGAVSHRRGADRRHADHHLQSRPDHPVADGAGQGRRSSFLDYAWVGNVSEDFRVCFTWNGTGIKNLAGFPGAAEGDLRQHRASARRPISTIAS